MATTSVTSAAPPAAPKSVPARPPAKVDRSRRAQLGTIAALAVAHVLLALVMRATPAIATAHALLAVGVCAIIAATTRRLANIPLLVAYLAGCEVLWRMCYANIFWEFGKYAVALILVIGILRVKVRRNRLLPVLYFALLLPSALLTFMALDLETARQEVSFTLSGPLAFGLAVLFFSNVRMDAQQVMTTFFAFIVPVLGISTLVVRSTNVSDHLEFVNAANTVTSGGYGPNQVSAVLGLALMFVLLFIIVRRLSWRTRVPLFLLAAALAAQSALTFARGGLAAALAGVAAAMFVIMRGNRRARVTVLVIATLGLGITKLVIEPKLEEVTNGEIDNRYTSTKSSGRDIFIKGELDLFLESPIMGVGPGIGTTIRRERGMFFGASHTEYSRMLAEHGMLGLLSLGCLIALCVRAVRRTRDVTARALSLAMVVWFALFLLVYSTRLATPAFVLGMAFATSVPARAPPKKKAIA
ncbi:MAG: O-antigen ligase family protein [Deltaproteobacteria bacterium]|nr:O-antigen ligase family protein [Deltaproteobacteria bacterium]